MRWAFDADVLIYAATPGHALGDAAWTLLEGSRGDAFGSALLVPELLIKPVASDSGDEIQALIAVLARLELVDLTEAIASLSVDLGAAYALRPADAVHLAGAVWVGADSFLTNNRRDFKRDRVKETTVVFPQDL